MTAVLEPGAGGDWTTFQRFRSWETDTAGTPTITRSGTTSPVPDREQTRRRRTDGEAVAAAGHPLTGLPGRWWPTRPCCPELVQHPRRPLEFNACVLPPAHPGTCLPAPRRQR